MSDTPMTREITHDAILRKVRAGSQLTEAEVEYILSTDLAGILPDPSRSELTIEVRPLSSLPILDSLRAGSGLNPDALASSSCNWVHMGWRQFSYLGFVIYRYNHAWTTCWNGTTVTDIRDRTSWLDETDYVVYDRGLAGNWTVGLGTSHAQSFMQRHIEYCVIQYGCYYSGYPWIQAHRYGNGTHGWTYGL